MSRLGEGEYYGVGGWIWQGNRHRRADERGKWRTREVENGRELRTVLNVAVIGRN